MIKYEIMTIVDPKANISVVENLLKEVFGAGVKKVEKLEQNELAYEINKSKHGQFVLASVEAKSSAIAEFTRRSNIIKEIWRTLTINLDSEKGLNAKPKKYQQKRKHVAKPMDGKPQGQRPYVKKDANQARSRVKKEQE